MRARVRERASVGVVPVAPVPPLVGVGQRRGGDGRREEWEEGEEREHHIECVQDLLDSGVQVAHLVLVLKYSFPGLHSELLQSLGNIAANGMAGWHGTDRTAPNTGIQWGRGACAVTSQQARGYKSPNASSAYLMPASLRSGASGTDIVCSASGPRLAIASEITTDCVMFHTSTCHARVFNNLSIRWHHSAAASWRDAKDIRCPPDHDADGDGAAQRSP